MDREKQIEGMARIICKPTSNKGDCNKCGFKKQCSKFADATNLYNAGYRKQTEGKWDDGIIGFCNVCMSCGAIVERTSIKNHSGKLNFCPSCGAKMKVKE